MAMIYGSVLPAMFWVYALRLAIIIHNHIPTNTARGWMSPLEAKYGLVPDISIFRVFGCVTYVHIADAQRTGVADKAYKGHFVRFKWPLLDRYLVYIPAIDKWWRRRMHILIR